MKNLLTIIGLFFIPIVVFGQAPQAISNASQIGWYGLPQNCIWTVSNGQINLPCTNVTSDSSVAINVVTKFGFVCDGVTDDTPHFLALQQYAVANDNSIFVFPPNSSCLTSWAFWTWQVHNAKYFGGNTKIVNTTVTGESLGFIVGGQDFVCQAYSGTTPTLNYYSYTNSLISIANSESKTITLATPSTIASWQVGDEILIEGYDEQQGGFPPNYRYYQRTQITAINYSTGVITIAVPLKYTYNLNWPWNNTANTYPPNVRNLNRGCPSGGSVSPTGYIHFEGLDFSVGANSSAEPVTYVMDGFLTEFINCKFGSMAPSGVQNMYVKDSTILYSEIDKLNGTLVYDNVNWIGDATGFSIYEATGVDLLIFNNDEFWKTINISAKRSVFNNSIFHYEDAVGYIGTSNYYYAESLVINNPTFVADGNPTPGGLVNSSTPQTGVVQTVGTNTFTLNLADGQNFIQSAGLGTVIYNSAGTSILGRVSDIAFNASTTPTAVVVTGVFSGITASQTISWSTSAVNLVMTNPIMTGVGSDINLWTPVFGMGYFPNQTIEFKGVTTVGDLGPCSPASYNTTKNVSDATSYSFGTTPTGGGTHTVKVVCDKGFNNWITY